jgi:hypothetical protein
VALGGSSYAAITLKRNSVKGTHIAKNAVTTAKVKNRSLLARDFAPGQLPKGEIGQTGPQGTAGETGPPGPAASVTSRDSKPAQIATASDTFEAFDGPSVTVQVPEGGALVVVGASVDRRNTAGGEAWAFVFEGAAQLARISESGSLTFETKSGGFATWASAGTHTYELRYRRQPSGTAEFRNRSLAASVLK